MTDGWLLAASFGLGLLVGLGLGSVDWFVEHWDAWDERRTREKWKRAMAKLDEVTRRRGN